jgi:hypothetical protein
VHEVRESDATGDALASYLEEGRVVSVLREGLLIAGWVAMWRPLKGFLYAWWPIRAEVHLFERSSTMAVRIEYKDMVSTEGWRSDWPAVPASRQSPMRRCRPTCDNDGPEGNEIKAKVGSLATGTSGARFAAA